jgi:hypothetical protein
MVSSARVTGARNATHGSGAQPFGAGGLTGACSGGVATFATSGAFELRASSDRFLNRSTPINAVVAG